MKKHLWVCVAVLLCFAVPAAYAIQLGTAAKTAPAKQNQAAPGLELAQTLSVITGVAISPLLGVSAVGAWTYAHAPAEQRASLPWFAQPWFWVPGLLVVLLVFLKDSCGTMIPTALKKPLDVAEAMENKVSGLIATGAFVPLIASVFHSVNSQSASLASAGFATIDPSPLYNALIVPFAMAAFVIVWIVSHAINMLILISPFSTVDAALKAFRTFLLSTVVINSFANPYAGAIWSAIIILICYFLAGWAFRLTTFGSLFIWDFCTLGRLRYTPRKEGNYMFLACEYKQVPLRTFGKLRRDNNGKLLFEYRRWLVFPKRTLELPPGKYAVGRGLLYPEILFLDEEEAKTIMLLPPRARTHEEQLAAAYNFVGVQDVGIVKGLKAIWNFIKRLFGVREPAAVSA